MRPVCPFASTRTRSRLWSGAPAASSTTLPATARYSLPELSRGALAFREHPSLSPALPPTGEGVGVWFSEAQRCSTSLSRCHEQQRSVLLFRTSASPVRLEGHASTHLISLRLASCLSNVEVPEVQRFAA